MEMLDVGALAGEACGGGGGSWASKQVVRALGGAERRDTGGGGSGGGPGHTAGFSKECMGVSVCLEDVVFANGSRRSALIPCLA